MAIALGGGQEYAVRAGGSVERGALKRSAQERALLAVSGPTIQNLLDGRDQPHQ
jgi:hypothetical protein